MSEIMHKKVFNQCKITPSSCFHNTSNVKIRKTEYIMNYKLLIKINYGVIFQVMKKVSLTSLIASLLLYINPIMATHI